MEGSMRYRQPIAIRILRRKTEPTAKKFTVNSATDSRRQYIVTRKTARRWMCSCPRWIFGVKQPDGSRRRVNCKHILSVRRAA
jgi:predicted nucleic acid-binding Zn finger protein